MKNQTTAESERRIDRMDADQIESFIENQLEKEGRQR